MMYIDLTTLISTLYIIGVLAAISYFLYARTSVPSYFSTLTPIAAALMLLTGFRITIEAYKQKPGHPPRAHGLEADFSSPHPGRYRPIGGIGGGLNWN